MKRRFFLSSGSAAVAALLAGCGGGGGGGAATDAAAGVNTTATPGTTGTTAGTVTATSAATTGTPTPAENPAQQPQQQPPAQQPQQQQPAGPRPAVAYPFGARIDPYVAGILPTVASRASMDASVKRSYDAWKAQAIADVPSIPGGKAVRFGRSSTYITVSEGMGYGMLIAVLMAGHDPQAREIFDGLLTTVRARPAYGIPVAMGGPYLMEWRLSINGNSAGDGWNAMDGDQDIAMALLMADRQWGSNTGRWNYKQEGIRTINAMKAWNMKPDGTTKGLATSHVSRTSDYMISHFRAYAKATGDSYWSTTVIDRCYWLIDRMQTVYSPGVGLMPDFIVQTDTANPVPSPGGMGDFVDTEMHYFANAQRNPWRWGTDYVTSGDVRWKNVLDKLVGFIQRDTGGNPAIISAGYRLDGTALNRSYSPEGFIGPMLCGALVNPSFQPFLNSLWTWNANNFTTDYYDSECQLIPMIVASGNWWQP
ncbi:MAG TPA: glycosyl hydrolase family 8 [Ramlibacter sp.]|nr:glycosyl hydrolase family 8 [Ramlibacter sp.]